MTQAVTVKNITFQEGETLICVPLIGKTLAELQNNARALATAGADIIEWRVDHFTQVRETEQVLLALGEIRQLLKEIPLLFTFRSKKEGGETEISDEAYFELNRQAAVSGLTDVIDIELFNDEAQIRRREPGNRPFVWFSNDLRYRRSGFCAWTNRHHPAA